MPWYDQANMQVVWIVIQAVKTNMQVVWLVMQVVWIVIQAVKTNMQTCKWRSGNENGKCSCKC